MLSARRWAILGVFLAIGPLVAQTPEPKPESPPPQTKLPEAVPAPQPAPVLPPAAVSEGPDCGHRTVCTTNVLLVPHEKATTMPDWKLRAVEVGRIPSGPVLEFREEKQCVTELKLVSDDVAQQVVVQERKPITVVDPHTGCAKTDYQICDVVKTVMVKVYRTVPVQREVIVRVPCLKPGPDQIVQKMVLDRLTVPAIEKSFTAVTTTQELKVPSCPAPCVAPHHP